MGIYPTLVVVDEGFPLPWCLLTLATRFFDVEAVLCWDFQGLILETVSPESASIDKDGKPICFDSATFFSFFLIGLDEREKK